MTSNLLVLKKVMSLSGRKEVPTQKDIHEGVLNLTREIQHAKIECDAENYSKNPDDENGEAKLLKDLEFLKMKLCEYMISLKERKIMRRGRNVLVLNIQVN